LIEDGQSDFSLSFEVFHFGGGYAYAAEVVLGILSSYVKLTALSWSIMRAMADHKPRKP